MSKPHIKCRVRTFSQPKFQKLFPFYYASTPRATRLRANKFKLQTISLLSQLIALSEQQHFSLPWRRDARRLVRASGFWFRVQSRAVVSHVSLCALEGRVCRVCFLLKTKIHRSFVVRSFVCKSLIVCFCRRCIIDRRPFFFGVAARKKTHLYKRNVWKQIKRRRIRNTKAVVPPRV